MSIGGADDGRPARLPTGPDGTTPLRAIEHFLSLADPDEAGRSADTDPVLRRPAIIQLLVARADEEREAGDDAAADRALERAALLAGSDEVDVARRLARLVVLAATVGAPPAAGGVAPGRERCSRGDGHGGRAPAGSPDVDPDPVGHALDRLVDVDVADLVERCHPRLRPAAWELAATIGVAIVTASGDPAAVEAAATTARRAVTETALDDPHRSRRLSLASDHLALLAAVRADGPGSGSGNDLLEEAIELARQAVSATPAGHPDRPVRLSHLAARLVTRHQRTGERASLDEAVSAAGRAVDLAGGAGAGADRARGRYLAELARYQARMFRASGDVGVLREAVDRARRAVAVSPSTGPDRSDRSSQLSVLLGDLYAVTGESEILTDAVRAGRDAVDRAEARDPDAVSRSLAISRHLHHLHQAAGDRDALDVSVRAARRAVELAPDDHRDHPRALSALADRVGALAHLDGNPDGLREAASVARRAVERTSADDPDRRDRLDGLTAHLGSLRRIDRGPELLHELTDVARRSVAATPGGGPDLARRLEVVAAWLGERYAVDRDRSVLDEAVVVARRSVAATPAGSPDLLRRLDILAAGLGERYSRHRDIDPAGGDGGRIGGGSHPGGRGAAGGSGETPGHGSDLDELVAVTRRLIELTPSVDTRRSRRLELLAAWLKERHRRSGDPADLARAAEAAGEAVAATPTGPVEHRSRSGDGGGVAADLVRRLDAQVALLDELVGSGVGQPGDVDRLVAASARAVALTPRDAPERPARLDARMAALIRRRATADGRRADPELIDATRDAAEAHPTGSPDEIQRRHLLLPLLAEHHRRTGHDAVLDELVSTARRLVGATSEAGPYLIRRLEVLVSALGRRYDRHGDPAVASEMLTGAQRLLDEAGADDPNRATHLHLLLKAVDRVTTPPGPELVVQAAEAARDLVERTPPDDSRLAERLETLADRLLALQKLEHRAEHTVEAGAALRRAVAVTPGDSPALVDRLDRLGRCLARLYAEGGERSVLEELVAVGWRAMEATDPGDPTGRPDAVATLAGRIDRSAAQLTEWHAVTGDATTTRRLLALHRRATELDPGPRGSSELATCLHGLSVRLDELARDTGGATLPEAAVVAARRAVAAASDDDDRGALLAGLAARLVRLQAATGDDHLAVEAVDAARRSVGSTPEGSPDLPRRLANLANHLVRRWETSRDRQLLVEAVAASRRSVAATAAGDPHLVRRLNALGGHLMRLHRTDGDPSILDEARVVARRASTADDQPSGSSSADAQVSGSPLSGSADPSSAAASSSDDARPSRGSAA